MGGSFDDKVDNDDTTRRSVDGRVEDTHLDLATLLYNHNPFKLIKYY